MLILPNTACLDDAQVAAVEQFVRNGGGLVASLDTSLFDEFGSARENFALAKVFGVTCRGLPTQSAKKEEIDINFAKSIGPDYWEKRKDIFDFRQDTASFLNQGKMKTYVADQSVTFKGAAVRVGLKGAKSIGTLSARTAGAEAMPAVVTHTHGKGRVVYLAAGFDSAHYLYAYPYQRLILAHAVRWAASAPQPVVVEAPMCVHSTLMRQTRGKTQRLIVHLFSDLNTTAFHALPNDDVPLREEVVPIHDIRVTFSNDYRFRSIRLEPEGIALKMEKTASGTSVIVPRLDVHSMVVGELEAP